MDADGSQFVLARRRKGKFAIADERQTFAILIVNGIKNSIRLDLDFQLSEGVAKVLGDIGCGNWANVNNLAAGIRRLSGRDRVAIASVKSTIAAHFADLFFGAFPSWLMFAIKT